INVSVSGVQQLSLVATNGIAGVIDYDHADWAGAELLTMAFVTAPPSAPTNLVAATASASQINLTWANTANNQAGLMLQRSTDGQNFTSVANIGAAITSYSDTGLAASTQYYYRIVAMNSGGSSVPSVVATATTSAAAPVNLSSLTQVSALAGWGTVQTDQSIKGNPLTLRGVVYAFGIGTHAPSTIVYNIGGNYKTFVADVGIDDETAGQGAADFQIYGDGVLLYDSGVVTGTSATQHVSINVAGVQQLSLVVSPGVAGTIDYDHADWAGAQLVG
ncbi:MAG TPA: NPCBM/NEW2 domain-containing protein, partial [Humisphaera sp.]|nr:NPCBM/NEW2 domain-containing protein [Humisphaera sp.]